MYRIYLHNFLPYACLHLTSRLLLVLFDSLFLTNHSLVSGITNEF